MYAITPCTLSQTCVVASRPATKFNNAELELGTVMATNNWILQLLFVWSGTPGVANAARMARRGGRVAARIAGAGGRVATVMAGLRMLLPLELTNADLELTNADLELTIADLELTNADLELTNADLAFSSS